ncbi:MAG TPA: DUF309 domain-containing protein [Candidatus Polarisedimenticolia bacterium]|nr:DUF309 domain-containing protein [Candidatus Polarisedimenticolia bacterium]
MDERRLQEAIALFNEARWFEAHEAFEDLWRASRGETRSLYQGIVQACAGLVKQQRGQPGPAVTLLLRGLGRIEAAPPACCPEIDAAGLAARLRAILGPVGAGARFEPPSIPERGRV